MSLSDLASLSKVMELPDGSVEYESQPGIELCNNDLEDLVGCLHSDNAQ